MTVNTPAWAGVCVWSLFSKMGVVGPAGAEPATEPL